MLTPRRYCQQPGCRERVIAGYCAEHARTVRPDDDVRHWYMTKAWSLLREDVLIAADYACRECGQIALTLDVDHIIPHGGDWFLFWDRSNLQALCIRCHSRKTRSGR